METKPHPKMLQYQNGNFKACLSNENENRVFEALQKTGHKWQRQVVHGWKVFDFWCEEIGVRVEVDGFEHDEKKDTEYDAELYSKTAILTFRVRNKEQRDIVELLENIARCRKWGYRISMLRLSYAKIEIPKPHKFDGNTVRQEKIIKAKEEKDSLPDMILSRRQLGALARALGVTHVHAVRKLMLHLQSSGAVPGFDIEHWKKVDKFFAEKHDGRS